MWAPSPLCVAHDGIKFVCVVSLENGNPLFSRKTLMRMMDSFANLHVCCKSPKKKKKFFTSCPSLSIMCNYFSSHISA